MQRLSIVGGDTVSIDWGGVLLPEEHILCRQSNVYVYDTRGIDRTKDIIKEIKYASSTIRLEVVINASGSYDGLYQLYSHISTTKDHYYSQIFELSIAQRPWLTGVTVSIMGRKKKEEEEEPKIRMILFN